MYFYGLMGCLKLTYHQEEPTLKVVYRKPTSDKKCVQRLLSPDPFMQAPGYSQGLNRYSYALNNPLLYTDPSGELAWFVPVIIGAVVGFEAGGWISSGHAAPWKWEGEDWKAAGVGAMIGAGAGALTAAAIGSAGGITGMTYATGSAFTPTAATTGWSITSNALLSANIGITSNLLQGRGIDGAFKGGLIGLAAGGLGAWSTTAIEGSSLGANLFAEEINTIGQAITGATYGFGDRFVRGHEMGYRGGKLWGTALLGMLEGGLSGYYGGTWGEDISFAGQSLITNSIASVPGLGFSIAKYYGYGLAAYGGVAAGAITGGGVASLFANQTLGAIAGGISGAAVGVGAFSLYPASLNYIKKRSGFYPTVLTVDQIIDPILQSMFR